VLPLAETVCAKATAEEISQKISNVVAIRMHRGAKYISSSPARTCNSPPSVLEGRLSGGHQPGPVQKRSIHDPGLKEETKINAHNCVKPF